MPIKLFPLPNLRFLNHSSSTIVHFTLMRPNSTLKPTRAIPILSRVFPHKLKYQALSSKSVGFPNLKLGVRSFSSRVGSEVRASKSLIDDEAELSDWVNELRSDSFKSRSYSEDDDNGGSSRGRGRSGYDRGGRSNGDSFNSSVKRRRGSDFDDNGGFNRDRGARDSFNSSPNRNMRGRKDGDSDGNGGFNRERGNRGSFDSSPRSSSRGKGRFGSEFDRKDESFGSRRENGFQSGRREFGESSRGRGSRGRGRFGGGEGSFDSSPRSSSRGKGRFGSEFDRKDESFGSRREDGFQSGRREFGESSHGRGSRGRGRFGGGEVAPKRGGSNNYDESRGGRGTWGSLDSFSQNSRGKDRFGNEMKGENDGFMSRRKDNTFQGGSRGGRQRRGGNSSGRLSSMASDEDIDDADENVEGEEKLMNSFRELISDGEDSDVDVDVDDDDEEEDEDSIADIVLEKGSTLSVLDPDDSAPVSPNSSSGGSDSYLSETRFDQCSVSALSLKAIKDAGYEKMTVVQEATLPVILKGKDVLAKAKTGTGKTVAFLLPSIEVVAKSTPPGRDQKRPPIFVLVICPTRELASQAAAEANKLVKYHSTIGVQVVIGGTRLASEQKRMQANPCQILVATPGRLKDHIENTSGFATRLMGVKVLVLDEADHLLDMGFRKDIERIIAAVPKQRQTLLFSATVPSEVRQICHIALKRDHEFINTVQEGSEETHAQVRQTHLVAPLDNQFPLLYTLLKDHIADDVDFKVLVFCTTAMVTRLVAGLLGELKLNVREIHSRKPQSYRTRVSDEFRKSKGLILVTSDVSARGVDYPDVTLVIQVGLPADKEQYIHRLGRTGRKGKEGQGILLLAPWEEFFLSTIRDLPISRATPPLVDPDMKKKVEKALSHVEMKNKAAAYQAWLGYYNSNKTVAKDKCRLVELANEFSRCMGLDNPPAIPKLVIGKMGLRNVPGLLSK